MSFVCRWARSARVILLFTQTSMASSGAVRDTVDLTAGSDDETVDHNTPRLRVNKEFESTLTHKNKEFLKFLRKEHRAVVTTGVGVEKAVESALKILRFMSAAGADETLLGLQPEADLVSQEHGPAFLSTVTGATRRRTLEGWRYPKKFLDAFVEAGVPSVPSQDGPSDDTHDRGIDSNDRRRDVSSGSRRGRSRGRERDGARQNRSWDERSRRRGRPCSHRSRSRDRDRGHRRSRSRSRSRGRGQGGDRSRNRDIGRYDPHRRQGREGDDRQPGARCQAEGGDSTVVEHEVEELEVDLDDGLDSRIEDQAEVSAAPRPAGLAGGPSATVGIPMRAPTPPVGSSNSHPAGRALPSLSQSGRPVNSRPATARSRVGAYNRGCAPAPARTGRVIPKKTEALLLRAQEQYAAQTEQYADLAARYARQTKENSAQIEEIALLRNRVNELEDAAGRSTPVVEEGDCSPTPASNDPSLFEIDGSVTVRVEALTEQHGDVRVGAFALFLKEVRTVFQVMDNFNRQRVLRSIGCVDVRLAAERLSTFTDTVSDGLRLIARADAAIAALCSSHGMSNEYTLFGVLHVLLEFFNSFVLRRVAPAARAVALRYYVETGADSDSE